MHAEHQDARARLVRPDAADQRQPAEAAALQAEIDDHHAGMVAAIEAVAGFEIARLEHVLDAGILEHAPASLQHDRMVVDDQYAGHDPLPMLRSCLRARSVRPPRTGMTMRTQVPRPAVPSTI